MTLPSRQATSKTPACIGPVEVDEQPVLLCAAHDKDHPAVNEFLPQHRTTPGPEGRSPPATSDIVTPDTSVPQSATDSRFQGRGVLVAHRAHTLAHTSRLGIIIPPREGVCPAISTILRPALRPLRALPTHTVTRWRPKAISTCTHQRSTRGICRAPERASPPEECALRGAAVARIISIISCGTRLCHPSYVSCAPAACLRRAPERLPVGPHYLLGGELFRGGSRAYGWYPPRRPDATLTL